MEDYKNCPVGIKNEQQIEHIQETFKMALERMEEKLDDLKGDVTSGFSNVNNRLDNLEKRLNNYEESLPKKIDERFEQKKGTAAASAWKWVFAGVGGSAVIAVITAIILKALNLG